MSDELSESPEIIENQARLPFDIGLQEAVLGHLRREGSFLTRSRGIIKHKWFGHGVLGIIWDGLCAFYDEFKRCPSIEELKLQFGGLTDFQQKNEIFAAIERCEHQAKAIQLDKVHSQCTLWLQSRIVMDMALKLTHYYQQEKIEDALKFVHEKYPQLSQANFDPPRRVSFSDTKTTLIDKRIADAQNACTTGCLRFDRAIQNIGGESAGGLLPGELTVVLAPVTAGKTSFMLTVAVQNVLKGKDVLILAHEDIDNIQLRIMMCATKCPASELVARYQDPKSFALIQEWQDKLERHLVFIPMDNPGGTFVEDVVATVQEAQRERKRQYGKGFDLVVDDYPARLLTRNGKYDEFRNRMYFTYAQFASLASSEQFHVLAAVQSNRDGARANTAGERALEMTDTSEAWGIPQLAHNFFTINQTDQDRLDKKIRFYLAKCRGADRSRTIVCKSRFDFYQTHGDDIGGCEVEFGWTKAIAKEVAAGGVTEAGNKIPSDNDKLSTHGKLVARQEMANRTAEQIIDKKAAERAEKERLENETAPGYSHQPDDDGSGGVAF